MSTKDATGMSDEALADAVAREVMGWSPVWMLTAPQGNGFISGHFKTAAECEAAWRAVPDMQWRFEEGWKPLRWWSRDGSTWGKNELNWRPDRDITAAWAVVEHFRDQPFSVRVAFAKALSRCAPCAWPDALMHLTAEMICRAALDAVRNPLADAP